MNAKELADTAELRHRIRRLLAVFRSITVHMQGPGDGQEMAQHLAGRVGALGRAAIASIAGMDLECLVLDELLAHGVHRAQTVVEGPQVRLNAKAAELMSLVIHELATNAVKFGALSQPRSRLRVVWWFIGEGLSRLHFEWAENGVRMDTAARSTPGFGSQVVKRLVASELHGDGELVFLEDGILCSIEFPSDETVSRNE
ncbi:MAG TPA: sensor histidine kinase [Steroidobacteraceae bacterium]|jgi:two-component sensor histidine kinase|nr:sensor histidine kinase [Steroidobacteraceae bacterium]